MIPAAHLPASRKPNEDRMAKTLSAGLDPLLSMADNGDYLPDLTTRIETLMVEMKSFSNAYGCKAKGKLTLTIDFTTDRFGAVDMTVADTIKVPKQPAAKAVLWATEDGRMTPHNPNQARMEIREASGRRELRVADED